MQHNSDYSALPDEGDLRRRVPGQTSSDAPSNQAPASKYQSLNYEEPFNDLYMLKNRKNKRQVYGYTGTTLLRWIVNALVGVLTGLAAISIDVLAKQIIFARLDIMDKLFSKGHVVAWLVFTLMTIVLVLTATILVRPTPAAQLCPAASCPAALRILQP